VAWRARTIDREFQICPDDLAEDVARTLGLENVRDLTIEEIKENATQRGFAYEAHRYGRHPTNQCPGLRNLNPRTMILRIRAGGDQSGQFARSFIVVAGFSNKITHIEAQYTYEPP